MPTLPVVESLECRRLMAAPDANWHMVWSDEFDGKHLDTHKWSIGLPWIGDDGTNRHFDATFLSYIQNNDVAVSDGTLKLLTEKRDMTDPSGNTYHYTEGLINTADHFKTAFGYFEARAKIPVDAGPGMWPAFWMLGLNWPPEDDVMEAWTSGGHLHQALAYGSRANPQWDGINTYGSLPAGFHTFAMEWAPGYQVFLLDGHITHTARGSYVPSQPMYMLLNSAVEAAHPPTGSTVFPNAFEVDYVRVYKRDPWPAVSNPSFEGGDLGAWTSVGSASVVAANPHTGNYSLQTSGAGAGAQQLVIGLRPNTTYVLSGWARVSDPSVEARIGVTGFGGSDTYASIRSTNYSQGVVTLTTGPKASTATIYATQAAGSGNAFFDDFSIRQAGVVTNGSFAGGSLGGWDISGAASAVQAGGRFALREDAPGTAAQQTVYGLSPGTTYRVIGRAKVSSPDDQALIGVKDFGGSEEAQPTSSRQFRNASLEFTTGPSSSSATVFCTKPIGSGSAWFKEMRLVTVGSHGKRR